MIRERRPQFVDAAEGQIVDTAAHVARQQHHCCRRGTQRVCPRRRPITYEPPCRVVTAYARASTRASRNGPLRIADKEARAATR